MHPKTELNFADGIRIVVPDSLELITTYVLREQGDWFEDEIRFVRSILRHDQSAIDIGANYGVFALSMARAVGPGGRVWAFEPASATAALLAESLARNGYGQVVLDRRALSEKSGTARLSLHDNAEFNELVRDGTMVGAAETVTLTSLDEAMLEHGWQDVALLKIDAEGEEAAIIRGGRQFLQAQSPLIQYEVKAGETVHLDLVQAFSDIGYASYRLVPGLGVLVPFDVTEPVDRYLLNLFCCRADRAAVLAADGQLVSAGELQAAPSSPRIDQLRRGDIMGSAYDWRATLGRLPYGTKLAPAWQVTCDRRESVTVERAIALHALSHAPGVSAAERVVALRSSFEMLSAACDGRAGFLRLASLSRVAQELGARAVAVDALDRLLKQVMHDRKVHPDEPFLTSSEYFDHLDPQEPIDNWVLSSILEGMERNVSFSSYYTGGAARQRLLAIASLGLGSPEMARRLALVEQRAGRRASPP